MLHSEKFFTFVSQLEMSAEDKQGMKSFETSEPKEVVAIMFKKFTANQAKQQLIIEYVTGKKSDAPAKKADADGSKKKENKDAASKRRPLSAYDNVKQVCVCARACVYV